MAEENQDSEAVGNPPKKCSKVLSKIKKLFKGGKFSVARSTPEGEKILGFKFTKRF